MTNFIIMAVVSNLNFSYFFRLMWEFLGLESERGGSICWPNNKIINIITLSKLNGHTLYIPIRLWPSHGQLLSARDAFVHVTRVAA